MVVWQACQFSAPTCAVVTSPSPTQNWVLVEAFLLFAGAMEKGCWRVEACLLLWRALAAKGCFVALERPRRIECPRVRLDSNIPKQERRGGRLEDGDDTTQRLACEGFRFSMEATAAGRKRYGYVQSVDAAVDAGNTSDCSRARIGHGNRSPSIRP
jgi:hypothetical protein